MTSACFSSQDFWGFVGFLIAMSFFGFAWLYAYVIYRQAKPYVEKKGCNSNCCNFNCNQGRDCPRRKGQ